MISPIPNTKSFQSLLEEELSPRNELTPTTQSPPATISIPNHLEFIMMNQFASTCITIVYASEKSLIEFH